MYIECIFGLYLLHGVAVFLVCNSKYSREKTISICFGGIVVQMAVSILYNMFTSNIVWPLFFMAFAFILMEFILLSSEPFAKTIFFLLTYSQAFMVIVFLAGLLSNGLFQGDGRANGWLRNFIHFCLLVIYAKCFKRKIDQVRQDISQGWGPMCFLAFLYMVYISYIAVTAQNTFFQKLDMVAFALFFFIMVTGYGVIFYTIRYMREAELSRGIEQQQKILLEKLELMRAAEEEARRVRHDIRHHLATIVEYAKNGENKALLQYLGEYSKEVENTEVCHISANPIADHVLMVYGHRARQKGIHVDYNVSIGENAGIQDVDMVAILANLMENAIFGCLNCGREEKYIKVQIKDVGKKLSIVIENSCQEGISSEFGGSKTEKRKGIGMSSILKSAEKYGGMADFTREGNVFISKVICTKRED